MSNQHTPPDQRKPKRRGKLVSLTEDERATLVAGAAALGETPTDTLRRGGLERAAWARTKNVRQAIPDASDVTPEPLAFGRAFMAAGTSGRVAPPITQVFACAYCPAEFCTSFDAETHIDAMHGDAL